MDKMLSSHLTYRLLALNDFRLSGFPAFRLSGYSLSPEMRM